MWVANRRKRTLTFSCFTNSQMLDLFLCCQWLNWNYQRKDAWLHGIACLVGQNRRHDTVIKYVPTSAFSECNNYKTRKPQLPLIWNHSLMTFALLKSLRLLNLFASLLLTKPNSRWFKCFAFSNNISFALKLFASFFLIATHHIYDGILSYLSE